MASPSRMARLGVLVALVLGVLAARADDCALLLGFMDSLDNGADVLGWVAGTDCCTWDGVVCGGPTRNVTRL